MLLTCRSIEAEEANRLGLCDKILKTGSVEEAEDWIKSLILHDRLVTSLVKSMCDKVGTVPFEESLHHEKRLFSTVWGGEANRKALDGKLKH
jgi:enoyl-CoA hydratase/carnithine racemase